MDNTQIMPTNASSYMTGAMCAEVLMMDKTQWLLKIINNTVHINYTVKTC